MNIFEVNIVADGQLAADDPLATFAVKAMTLQEAVDIALDMAKKEQAKEIEEAKAEEDDEEIPEEVTLVAASAEWVCCIANDGYKPQLESVPLGDPESVPEAETKD